jgi:hypothetical protein
MRVQREIDDYGEQGEISTICYIRKAPTVENSTTKEQVSAICLHICRTS